MVSLLEHQAETQIPPIDQTTDRPTGRSIFIESQTFHLANSDLFADDCRRVATREVGDDEDPVTQMVAFDVSKRKKEATWHYSVVYDGQRLVSSLTASRDGRLTGWAAHYDQQGTPRQIWDMDDAACQRTWQDITKLIYTPSTKEQIAEIRDKKERKQELLAEFSLRGQITYELSEDEACAPLQAISEREDEKGKKFYTFTTMLSKASFKEALKKRETQTANFGFEATSQMRSPDKDTQLNFLFNIPTI